MTDLPGSGEDDVVAAPARLFTPLRGQGRAGVAVALGGAVGAVARWAVGLAVPHAPGTFPWGTFGINVLGGLLIGVLVVEVTEHRSAHPLVRPFAITGVLGGFTTFSTYTVDAQQLLLSGRIGTAAAYLAGTLAAAVTATAGGLALARAVHR